MNRSSMLRWGAGAGGLAVVLGAFGAHGLESRLSADMLDVFEIGVRYHMYHALALLALAAFQSRDGARNKWHGRAALLWLLGILIFSGSLYALALSGIGWLGAITPIGGVAFIAGWAAAFAGARE